MTRKRKGEYERVRMTGKVALHIWPQTKALLDELYWHLRESRVQILSYAVKEYHARVMQEAKK